MNSTLVAYYMPLETASDGKDIDQAEKGIMLAIAYHANIHDGWCYPSQDRIARFARISVRSAQRGLDRLTDRGVIELKRSRNEAGQFDYVEYRIVGSEQILKAEQERYADRNKAKPAPKEEPQVLQNPHDNLSPGPHDSHRTAIRQPYDNLSPIRIEKNLEERETRPHEESSLEEPKPNVSPKLPPPLPPLKSLDLEQPPLEAALCEVCGINPHLMGSKTWADLKDTARKLGSIGATDAEIRRFGRRLPEVFSYFTAAPTLAQVCEKWDAVMPKVALKIVPAKETPNDEIRMTPAQWAALETSQRAS